MNARDKAAALAKAKDDERRAKLLGKATLSDLASEMIERDDFSDEWLIDYFNIEPGEAEPPFAEHAREISEIYDAIAQGRAADALQLLYDLTSRDVLLVAPNSALRLARSP